MRRRFAMASMIRPHGASTFVTFAPQRSATSAMRLPKTPFTPMTTSSPGSIKIHKTKFHARAAGAADRERHFIFRHEDNAQHRFDFLHHLHENRIEMADERQAHGAEN